MNGDNKFSIKYLLWFLDMVVAVICFYAATFIRFQNFRDMYSKNLHFLVCVVIIFVASVYSFGVDYNRDFMKRRMPQESYALIKYEMVIFVGTTVIIYLINIGSTFSRLVMFYFAILDYILTLLSHHFAKTFLGAYWKNADTAVKMLVLTEEKFLEKTIRHLQHHLDINYRIVGAVCLDKDMKGEVVRGVNIIADRKGLLKTVTIMPLDDVFIYTPDSTQNALEDVINAFQDMGVRVNYCVELPGMRGRTSVDMIGGYSVVTYSKGTGRYRALIIKRMFDILGGLVGIIFTGILTVFVGLAIKIDSPGPIFFSQTRIGRNGRRFKIYKFRSMYIDAEERKKELESQNEMTGLMFKMKDDPRITKVGAFIRKTSLDEFPQFLNILKGDMSLVGTRPPTEAEFEQYNEYYRRRISMTPGLTGMWQVSGRSDIEDFDEIVKLDLQYIDNWSLGLDLKILLKTVSVVFKGSGAS
ncbi:exopolysaccharide biosynthesis polyprenyl glycosylphosphotransferase [Butyrivibrio fibrisolvens DSM 3071]|uniref:Exopolysaccharide biosynthesis polyprenyl glycosylphosphotransferase n=1 Tax=Butyrivibrio fibrisolvens DSM 3071 TaxID=1121131 RepID=A0A1M5XU86_BUTFI|nr:sugar transferase [Butyrivibrio fibrisolvens]SHI03104.1 exopolysaccharide biosynthesis polyprenyl glycosylphosphotransferase [Butyrivibrio fibrisolvens DSM 3071]